MAPRPGKWDRLGTPGARAPLSPLLPLFLADKGPVTSLLPSQVNSSPVINHLLLGKKMKTSSRGAARNAVVHTPGHPGGGASPAPYEDLRAKLNSPWRTHIRVHKKALPRARSQPGGCGDTEGLIAEPGEGCRAARPGEGAAEGGPAAAPHAAAARTIEGQSPEPAFGDADVAAVRVRLEALELSLGEAAEPRWLPPGPQRLPELPEAPGEDRAAGKAPHGSRAKTPIFSPFPSVKPLRKSAAARNLGLYGPTERTPTVHFPHMSRSFSKAGGGGGGGGSTKKR